jgi:hypothetical protein
LALSSHVEAITSGFSKRPPTKCAFILNDQQAGESLPMLIRRIEALLPLGANGSPSKPTTMNN